MIKLDWEEVEDNHAGYMYRSMVPGGWLVKITEDVCSPSNVDHIGWQQDYEWRSSLTFIPDPTYEWK